MKKPPVPNPRERKKFMFYDSHKRQADLRIRLKFDGMNQSQFFRAMITGYLEKDDLILKYIDDFKKQYELQGKSKRAKSKKLIEDGKRVDKQYKLGNEELEDIFDVLAEEHPDL